MHVISPKRLREFWREHPDSERPLRNWLSIMEERYYASPHEVKLYFGGVDFLGDGRTVFDIGGNKYRLVVNVMYDYGRVYVLHVLTHRDYDRRCKEGWL